MMVKAACGRFQSRRGKPFNRGTIRRHERDCERCREILGSDSSYRGSSRDNMFSLTSMIAGDDMPDGAYFALAWELGEL
jgi:hypothetical protein